MATPVGRSANIQINSPRLLLVEGNDEVQFFRRIITRRHGENVQIIDFGGKDKLGAFLTNVLVPRIRATEMVRVIGIVRDADEYYDRAFQSVCDSLRRSELSTPRSPMTTEYGTLDGADIQVAVYIMPDNESSGDLETLILRAIEGTPALDCVEDYIECLQANGQIVQHERKAKLHAFLASNTRDPTLQPGEALDAGVIPWRSPAFDDVHKFLDMLDAVN